MSIELDIQTLLGALVSGRCYPLVAPDSVVKPYITFQVITEKELVVLDGPTGTENKTVQVNVWAKTYGEAKTLKQSIKDVMKTAVFANIPIPGGGDRYEPETQLYGEITDFSVWTQ